MLIVIGGMIKKDLRGPIGVVLYHPTSGSQQNSYGIFAYPLLSDEFIHATGVWQANNTVRRIYAGLDTSVCNDIARDANGANVERFNLRDLDRKVIEPFFLDKLVEREPLFVIDETG